MREPDAPEPGRLRSQRPEFGVRHLEGSRSACPRSHLRRRCAPVNQTLANPDAAGRHRRLPSFRQLAGVAALFLAMACSAAPSAPGAAPTLPAIASAPSATASAAPPRTAAETYERGVKLDNQRSLKDAAVPFATYLVAMHRRIHPVFAEELAAFEKLPRDQALDGDLATTLEIVVDKNTGKLVRMGVVKASGRTAFDIAALSAVTRAAPFGQPPDIIVSPDGNVYLHWEFQRDPEDACATRNAFPFLLKSTP